MPALADLQRSFARALFDGPERLPAELFAPGPTSACDALGVYRNTVLGGLSEALALTFPTVQAVVGEAFFDQAAVAYARAHPPSQARLSGYGRDFPRFLETYAPAAQLDYLADTARLDLAIEAAGQSARLHGLVDIDPGVRLSLPVSLRVLELQWPADQIRDALDAGDDEALAAVELRRGPRWFAVWRAGAGAALRPLSAAAGLFLQTLLGGAPAAEALALAAADGDRDAALLAIQADVFAASFAQVVTPETRSFQPCSP